MEASAAQTATADRRIARAFGLKGEAWMRHANPASVWSRFTCLSLIAVAVWSRDWLGVWSLVPVALSIAWLFVNPLFFQAPASTRHWASRATLGERIWVDRKELELPEGFRSNAFTLVSNGFSTIGLALLAYGLVDLNVLATVTGILITHGGKVWYLDRMALLFTQMK